MFVVTLSGLSCSGKTYVAESLPDLMFSSLISTTTRPQRRNEIPGFDYDFVTTEQFGKNSFLEQDIFAGYSYGLTYRELGRIVDQGRIPVHVCTPAGALSMRQHCSQIGFSCLSVFIDVPLELAFFRMLKRWMRDKSFPVSYLAERISALVSVESQWSLPFNILTQGGTDSFDPLMADIISIVKGEQAIPPLQDRKPCGSINEPINFHGLLSHAGRPKSADDCQSIAALLCDHLSNHSFEGGIKC